LPDALRLLVLADMHYVHHAGRECSIPRRLGRFGLEWTRRAVEESSRLFRPDVIVILGDVVDDGLAPGAEEDIQEFAAAVREAGLPVVAVPGNHDGDPEALLRAFGDRTGPHPIRGYNLYTFADVYSAGDVTHRPPQAIHEFLHQASDAPLIAIQHNPIYPPVDGSGYPYMPTNAEEIISSYERAGVILSLSGHYHRGHDLAERNGVNYLTCAALTESPFPFYLVTVRGRTVEVRRLELRLPDAGLVDCHIHTHFGYCAVDVHPEPVADRAGALGLEAFVCVEHAGQLYLPPDDFWNRRHVEDPAALRRAREAGSDRMAAFRSAMAALRRDGMYLGLEAECDRAGRLTLLDEDRQGWDVLLGAVHWLPSDLPANTPAQRERSFLRVVEHLVQQGIDVLAHPWRCFSGDGSRPSKDAYRAVARLLAAAGVAAEINFHGRTPDPEFFRICAEEGTPIALGSDAHYLREVGDLHPHLRLLREIGYPIEKVQRLPTAGRRRAV